MAVLYLLRGQLEQNRRKSLMAEASFHAIFASSNSILITWYMQHVSLQMHTTYRSMDTRWHQSSSRTGKSLKFVHAVIHTSRPQSRELIGNATGTFKITDEVGTKCIFQKKRAKLLWGIGWASGGLICFVPRRSVRTLYSCLGYSLYRVVRTMCSVLLYPLRLGKPERM